MARISLKAEPGAAGVAPRAMNALISIAVSLPEWRWKRNAAMELHQIRYFLAVCDTLNFTRAAERCHVSQPSLTRAVKLLEDELGGALFRRERRLNVLIYLNRDWREEYGGALEIWDTDKSACVRRIVPIFNRCVVFDTTKTSFHGNPEPVAHPDGRPRRSIALYYYTARWDAAVEKHSTIFDPDAA